YRVSVPSAAARRLFRVYLTRINELADHPEFYHLLSNSCTVNIVRYANQSGRSGRTDFRHYLNGLIDSYLYESGRIDTPLSFDELRRRSWINELAQTAGKRDDFWQQIRRDLPSRPYTGGTHASAGDQPSPRQTRRRAEPRELS